MLKKVVIHNLFESKEPTTLSLENKLYIITGDNGSGKTTILNHIYYALNGNFEWFFGKKFRETEMIFTPNKLNIKKMEIRIVDSDCIKVDYLVGDIIYSIEVSRLNPPRGGFQFIFCNEDEDPSDEDEYGIFRVPKNNSINDLIKKHITLRFISEIRKSLLYFPTYRRIDNDIKNLLENTTDRKSDYIFYDLDKKVEFKMHDFLNDRRVIGVGDKDIEIVYKKYSDDLRAFNSEGLNELLKNFIQAVIERLYKDEDRKLGHFEINTEMNTKAPFLLEELADKLELSIEKDKVHNFYDKRNLRNKELVSLMNKNGNINIDLANNRGGIKNGKKEKKVTDKGINDIIKSLLFGFSIDMDTVDQLLNLYSDHIAKQEKLLEPYRFISEGFDMFFNNKLKINMDSKKYDISFSKPFSRLSTGEKQLITILSYYGLALRDGPLDPFVIIDEPELSLHVSWQNKLLNHLLKNEKTNLLIATHSPFVANMNKYGNFIHQLGDIDANY
ncbi:ATP-binding protein [Bacillus sp. J14TS2]|uniref:AAA family ATPase n=1 Tax=Bacillus sp. J14TS2 TaxID=2807188 RepID=UPI001B2F05AD|nr:AAA family ATPase [Bacillus sp. J14TS2]GIN71151.1 ATP-binding protein [Bacillus sp. J14TS2]